VECLLRKNCFTFFFFFATPKSHPQKTAARSKNLSFQQRGDRVNWRKRKRERNREKEIERKREGDRQGDHSPIWGIIKKYSAICLPFSSLFFFPPFSLFFLFLSMSTSTRAFIHAKITKYRVKCARKYVSTAVAEMR